jgi:hypothetical protein
MGLVHKPLLISEYGAMVEWKLTGKTEMFEQKPTLLPLCPSQIPHGLPWNWTLLRSVRSRRLDAWAITRTWHFMEANVQLRMSGHFTPKSKMADVHWTDGWMGPRASLDVMAETTILSFLFLFTY